MRNAVAPETVPLTTAAMRLGLGYFQARDLLLRGELRGFKDARGRYQVQASDLARVLSERAAAVRAERVPA